MMLLALLAFGMGTIFARRGAAGVPRESQLAKLKAAVERPNPKLDDWLDYAKALRACRLYKDAAVAFDQALKIDPYKRDARLGGAYCRAILGRGDSGAVESFKRFMEETIAVDPKTAKAIFEQPEVLAYLDQPRFKALQQDAIAGSMD
jgi:hypothetical protein